MKLTIRKFLATGLAAAQDNAWDQRIENINKYALLTIFDDIFDGEEDSLPESGYLLHDYEDEHRYTRGQLRKAFAKMLIEALLVGGLDNLLDQQFRSLDNALKTLDKFLDQEEE